MSGGTRVRALDGLSLTLPRGRIFTLLGPNGAGKTTAIRILVDALDADGGDARVLGRTPGDPALAGRIGYLPEHPALYPYLTGREHLEYFARFLPRAADARALIERVSLGTVADRPVSGYSRGMRVRLGLAIALLPEPEILILDEPFEGLDPVGRIDVREILRALKQDGRALLVSTHDLAEAEKLADEVGLIVAGRMRREGALAEVAGASGLESAFLAEVRG